MARGRLLKTKVKEEKALTKARLKAEAQFLKTSEGQTLALKKWIGETLKNKPIEISVFLSLTYLCYITIETSTEIIEKLGEVAAKMAPIAAVSPILGPFIWPILGYAKVTEIGEKIEAATLIKILLAMTIAYLIMKHGWELITGISGGIGGIAKILIAA